MKDYNQTYEKIKQLVEKFTNGKERYQVDALLHNIIDSLARGADPIEIIDQLIIMNNDLVKKYIELVAKSPVAYIINKDMIS
jgi:hypothetical protein